MNLFKQIINVLANHFKRSVANEQATEPDIEIGTRKIVYRQMVPLTIILAALLIGFGLAVTVLQHHHLNQNSLYVLNDAVSELAESLAEQSRDLNALGYLLIKNPVLKQALNKQDRVALLTEYQSIFSALKKTYGITHLYFHRPDLVNLLRVHKPSKHGDLIDRFTARKAHRTAQTAAGIELGPLGTFTVRSVQPVMDGKHCIGYLELGKEIEDILASIHNRRGVELAVVIGKKFLDRSQWESGMAMLGRHAYWDQFSDDALVYCSVAELVENWQFLLGTPAQLKHHKTQHVAFSGRSWHLMAAPLRDVSGQAVGSLILLYDISDNLGTFAKVVFMLMGVAFIILIVLFYCIYSILKRTEGRLSFQQKNLLTSEQRFKQMAEFLPLSLFETDISGRVTFANACTLQLTGYNEADIAAGFDMYQAVHLNDQERALQLSLQVLEGNFSDGEEYLLVKKDGTPFPAFINTRPRLIDGKPVGLKGYIFDLTERKAFEKALQESEANFRVLIENTPDVITRYDDQCRHLYMSPAVGNHLNYDPAMFIGKTHRELGFSQTQAAFWEQSILETFKTGQPLETEFEIEGNNGLTTFNWRLVPEFEEGQVKTVLSIGRDITSQKASERKYSSLFNKMTDGFTLHEIICDEQGRPCDYRFLAANPAFEKMTGLKADTIVGKRVLEVLPNTEQYWIDVFGKVALTGEVASLEDYSQELGRYYRVTAYRPEPMQFAAIVEDVTERKQVEAEREKLEAQLQQAQKMESIGTLAGGIAHDFNNILFPIIGFVEMMLDSAAEGSDLWQNLNEVLTSSLRARDLVQQILAFSRQAEKELKPLKVQTIVSDVLRLMRASLPSTISIQPEIDTDCGMVLADTSHIQQVVMNLITNAFHAMADQGGTLGVQVAEEMITTADQGTHSLNPGRYVKLSVSDTGTGIDPQILNRLFDPYFTTKPQGKGTGLGLSVVHGIVKSYSGDIQVFSKQGQGSVFHIYLPMLDMTDQLSENKLKTTILQGNGEHILLIDDEEAILSMESKILEHLGYRVTMHNSSIAGLEAFQSAPQAFDLIITDMTMPEMTGDKVAAIIKSIREDIPVILCTGFSDIISKEKIETLGIENILMKPIVLSDFSLTIREALDRPDTKPLQ